MLKHADNAAKGNGWATVGRVSSVAGLLIAGSTVLKKYYDKISNDVQRKSMLEDLCMHDPIIRGLDRKQVLEWYASIMHFAPTASKDKSLVRETLQSFARFGKPDLATLKMLAETEKAMDSGSSMRSWGDLISTASNVGRLVGGLAG